MSNKRDGRGKVYNRIFSEEAWVRVNKENIAIINDFIAECKQRQLAKSTVKQYYNDLRIILIYISQELDNKSLLELDRRAFRGMSIHFTEVMKVSNARSNRLMSAVRSMLDFVEDEDSYEYDRNLAARVKGLPKKPVRTNEDNFYLSYEQITKLRDELVERDMLQDAVMLMLFYDSGARRNEIAQVLKSGLTEGHRTNRVDGKGGKEFTLIYMEDTRELIAKYLEQRGEDNIESLWVTEKGDAPLSYEAIYGRVTRMSRILSEIEGELIEFFPHSLRHSRAETLKKGEDPRIVDKEGKPKKFELAQISKLLNHESSAITESYVKDNTEEEVDGMFGFA